MKMSLIAAASALALVAGSAGASVVVTVQGTSDPFLAGAPAGGSIGWGNDSPTNTDTAPADSPTYVAVTPGGHVTISNVTGAVSNGSCCAPVGPAGGGPTGSIPFNAVGGFTELVAGWASLPINSLVGVFLDPNTSDPGVDQVFYIGAGGTFVVPTGTTGLYLATVDGYQWNNNFGSFTATAAVPEPAAWAMMLVGIGGLGGMMRARRKQTATL